MGAPLLYPRHLVLQVEQAMQDTPVVLLAGPRQAGKTTLARQQAGPGMPFLTLDDSLTLMAARQDPTGLIRRLDRAVIDEIQRAPELLLALKKTVDEDRRPGRFLLTGSANLMTMPTVADSLAGRMEKLTLLPLSQSEIAGSALNWIDAVLAGDMPQAPAPALLADVWDRVMKGGYPEMLSRATPTRRRAWARQYLEAILARDVRDLAQIDKLDAMPRLLRALAATAGQVSNLSALGAQVGLDSKTVTKYMGILEQLYLLQRVPVWSRNPLGRVIKSPKLQFLDPGLLCSLLDLSDSTLRQEKARMGPALETFVYSELRKHAAWAGVHVELMYFRNQDQVEVDIVLETSSGDVIGIEVKAAATVHPSDLRGLKTLAALAGPHFKAGVVLHDGDQTLPLGDRLWALPLSTLWAPHDTAHLTV